MKYSFSLLKKFLPVLKSKKQIIEALNAHSFETVDLGADGLEAMIPPNRFSDAASHRGLAREIAAVLDLPVLPDLPHRFSFPFSPKQNNLRVFVRDQKLCRRYTAQIFEGVKIGSAPQWMREILTTCGLRPINNVVDAMNYAMLETGQPLHAFDFDKIAGAKIKDIIIRKARKGEKIRILEGEDYRLDEDVLVIADAREPLAVAGVKGGQKAEINEKTERIVVESANFYYGNIYKTSRRLGLVTDAALRFSRNLSPELTTAGIVRAAELLEECAAAKPGGRLDFYPRKSVSKIVQFDLERFNRLVGAEFDVQTVKNYLLRLGFTEAGRKKGKRGKTFLFKTPILRTDIENQNDLTEEIVRLRGYDEVVPWPPAVNLELPFCENLFSLKNQARNIMVNLGFDEVGNRSFVSKSDGEKFGFGGELAPLENPVSKEFYYLRPSLASGLRQNIEDNFRFFDEAKIFEIGKTFCWEKPPQIAERTVLAAAISAKNKESFFGLKGAADCFLRRLGLTGDIFVSPEKKAGDWVSEFTGKYLNPDLTLKIEFRGKIFGYLGQFRREFAGNGEINVLEIDLDALSELSELEKPMFFPLPKFPSVKRDISFAVSPEQKIGEIIKTIKEINLECLRSVELLDEYVLKEKENFKSLTIRLFFQLEERTLLNEEAEKMTAQIIAVLRKKHSAEIR